MKNDKNPPKRAVAGDFVLNSECPITVSEHGNYPSVAADSVDIKVVRAYHKVDVYHGVVDSHFPALLKGVLFVISDAIYESHSERKVAARVFIKESVAEGQLRVTNGRIVRHECDLTEIRRAIVHGYHLLQKLTVFLCRDLNSLTALKSYGEVLDKLAAIRKRLRCHGKPVGTSALGRGKDLLGRNVGVEKYNI